MVETKTGPSRRIGRSQTNKEKQKRKVLVLTTPNEHFHKITDFITFREIEKVCFNYTRHSKQITPRKTCKKNRQFNYRKQRFVKNDRFRNITRKWKVTVWPRPNDTNKLQQQTTGYGDSSPRRDETQYFLESKAFTCTKQAGSWSRTTTIIIIKKE